MPPVSGIGNPPAVQPPTSGGHSDHGANVVTPRASAGQSFSTVLAQAISQAPGSGGQNSKSDVPSGGSHPQHFPIGASNHGGEHGFQETALGLRAYRQQLIASNIANADTPGYKAVDIDFQEALGIARSVSNTSPLALSATTPGHIAGKSQFSAPPYLLKYHVPAQPSADGNTVEMDVERAKFAENSLMYEFSLDRVKGHFMMISDMLRNLKD
ncbi:MAG: flagellar basal body rod protein FlgB [Rhodocyclaceae bacterium]|nr:MAG: flagellar basal body rod protein FlgB [Rhodocyclaceae bacterium]